MRPRKRIADLFCGAGGAAMGLHRAGFEIVGFDIKDQPRYPFEFHQKDVMTMTPEELREFDAVWASPPCQGYSQLRHLPWIKQKDHWRSIPPTRELLISSGLPYIIENVEGAKQELITPITLCGFSFGLPVYRHRCFETSGFWALAPSHRKHHMVIAPGRASLGKRHHGFIEAMGIDWMTRDELTQAIPPAYSEYLGKELMKVLESGLEVELIGYQQRQRP